MAEPILPPSLSPGQRRALDNAQASLRLEGLIVPPQLRLSGAQVACGALGASTYIAERLGARCKDPDAATRPAAVSGLSRSVASADPYLDPHSGLLRNRAGAQTAAELTELERDLSFVRAVEIELSTLAGSYDLAHLARFHRQLFGDLYPWAGEIRTVDIAKTAPFAFAGQISSYFADAVARPLQQEQYLRDLECSQFIERLTHYLGEINAIHPFREGNGRTQRAFFGQLAREAGYQLDWTGVNEQQNIEASRAAMAGQMQPLRELLECAVIDPGL